MHQPATAARLFERVLAGGGAAAGHAQWGFVEGARADLLVADPACEATLGTPKDSLLDALVFAGALRPWRDVMVAGRWVLREHQHADGSAVAARFEQAMNTLWQP
jgi:formimidoylglutamate deiminase